MKNQQQPIRSRNPERMKKTIRQSETMAFTSQLFYYAIKLFVCFILYSQNNIIWGQPIQISVFILLLCLNSYLITFACKNSGFEQSNIETKADEQQHSFQADQLHFCDICKCVKKMRTKHCFRCGRCVRKYDHHCPWIGACVGQRNHSTFVLMLFFQTLQSSFAFYICFFSLQIYEYKQEGGNFGQQFGIFACLSIFMFFYVIFTGGLLFFHSYLILMNLTTNELVKRSGTGYLKGIKGNPFYEGLIKNIKLAIIVPQEGHNWSIKDKGNQQAQRSFLAKVWSNQYYSCC